MALLFGSADVKIASLDGASVALSGTSCSIPHLLWREYLRSSFRLRTTFLLNGSQNILCILTQIRSISFLTHPIFLENTWLLGTFLGFKHVTNAGLNDPHTKRWSPTSYHQTWLLRGIFVRGIALCGSKEVRNVVFSRKMPLLISFGGLWLECT